MRETSWGSEFGWDPVGRRRSQPHVWDSWLVAAAAWSNRSSGAGIRVTDGTHQGSTNRLAHPLSSPTTVNQLVTTQALKISQRQRPPRNESARGYISPPTWGEALARIISLSIPHWPTAAPFRGGYAQRAEDCFRTGMRTAGGKCFLCSQKNAKTRSTGPPMSGFHGIG